MDYYDNSSHLFDDLINVQDSCDFFDALVSSRNVLYPPQDMQLQYLNPMDCYHPEMTFAQQSTGSEAPFDNQNVLEVDNTLDGLSSPWQSNASDLLASAVSEIGDLGYFSCEDSIPSGSSCCSQMEVCPVPAVAVAGATMTLEPAGVQSNQELFEVLIERGKKIQSPAFKFSSGLNKLFANRNADCPVQFKTAIPAQFEGQFSIRVYVSFTELAHQWEPVLCCKADAPGPLMRCNHNSAVHEPREIRGVVRDTILLPLNAEGGLLCATWNLRFVCFSTHPTIQRPTQLNFTLVDERGNSVAEKIIQLKMCARPGRSIEAEEKKKGIFTN